MNGIQDLSIAGFWRRVPFPDQVKRLLIIFIVILAALVTVRSYLTPPTFGEFGHYRSAAVDSISALPVAYAGQEICAECHNEQAARKLSSHHQKVSCEVCHGPGALHTEDPAENHPEVPRQRDMCALCHAYNASKPTGHPQIDPALHNPMEPCMSCHDPHDPKPPHVPEECSACHGEIARTKAVSPHAALECIQCHKTPEEHKSTPHMIRPGKPQDRAFCGGCHAKDAKSAANIPRVDLNTHETKYVCWQCHYPHYPEVR